jgi:endonuclease YncB( thermonuclease family)
MRFNSLTAAFLLVLAASACSAAPKSFEARVIGIADGDTLTVLNSDQVPHKIRLAGIDAPEKGQAFGERSKQNLDRWVRDKTVRIEWTKIDKYGRLVSKVLVAPPGPCPSTPCPTIFDVNLDQVSAGFAWHYKYYEDEQSEQDRRTYALAEQRARKQKLGLWRDANPLPPWEERHGSTDGPVKKSHRSDTCHTPGSNSYGSTKRFDPYPTLEECIASGGHLP